jgi:hypothetical protein
MAATFSWYEDNGAGPTISSGVSQVNWKSVDDVNTAYTAAPITAGQHSYQKNQYGVFSGTYNQILNGYFDHTAGTLGSGLFLYSAANSGLTYVQPAQSIDARLTKDMTLANGSFPTSAVNVYFNTANGVSPTAAKSASTTANPTATQYLATQMRTSTDASAGDTTQVTLTLRFDEN